MELRSDGPKKDPPSPTSRFGTKRKMLHLPQAHMQQQQQHPNDSAHPDPAAQGSSPVSPQIVRAEGNDFVIEPAPSKPSSASSTPRRVSQSAASTPLSKSQSAMTAVTSPLQGRSVSASAATHATVSFSSPSASSSVAAARRQPVEKPYRPPPSSSAKFYARQQHLWRQSQPHLAQVSPTQNVVVSSPALNVGSLPQLSEPARLLEQMTNPASKADNMQSPPAHENRPRSGSSSSFLSRFRAASVSSAGTLDVPDEDGNASIAGSFTRSRISPEQCHESDDEADLRPGLDRFGSPQGQLQSPPPPRRSSLQSSPASFLSQSTISRHQPSHLSFSPQPKRPSFDASSQSHDADWDQELGIADVRHSAPLLLPALQLSQPITPQPRTEAPVSVSSQPQVALSRSSSNRVFTSVTQSPLLNPSTSKSTGTAELRGIRVTSSVSESWDDDFLFQNEEEEGATCDAQRSMRGDLVSADRPASSPGSKRFGAPFADDDEGDVLENWDDAFSWNGDARSQPAMSNTTSLKSLTELDSPFLRPRPNLDETPQNTGSRRNSLRGGDGPASGTMGHHDGDLNTDTHKRSSNSSIASEATDISARLAAQSEISSWNGSHEEHATSRQANAFGNALGLRTENISARNRLAPYATQESDGENTETESAPVATIDAKIGGRRSLARALGFDASNRSSNSQNSARFRSSPVEPTSPAAPEAESSQNRTKSKIGAFYRFSLSRSRTNVASDSVVSLPLNEDASRSPASIYSSLGANASQASVLSQLSVKSNGRSRAQSPASLEQPLSSNMNAKSGRGLLFGASRDTASPMKSLLASPASNNRRFSTDNLSAHSFSPELRSADNSSSNNSHGARVRSPSSSCHDSNDMSEESHRTASHRKNKSSFSSSFGLPRPFWPKTTSSKQTTSVQTRPSATSASSTSPDALQRTESHTQRLAFREQPDVLRRSSVPESATSSNLRSRTEPVPDTTPKRASATSAGVLRRDFSSSTTLRAEVQQDSELTRPTRTGSSTPISPSLGQSPAQGTQPSTPVQRSSMSRADYAHRFGHGVRSQSGSGGTTSSSTRSGSYASNRNDSISTPGGRSVSASTAHSYGSSDAGSRIHYKETSLSGFETHDTETTYGTSVSSSPAGGSFPLTFVRQGHRKPSLVVVERTNPETERLGSRISSQESSPLDSGQYAAISVPASPVSSPHGVPIDLSDGASFGSRSSRTAERGAQSRLSLKKVSKSDAIVMRKTSSDFHRALELEREKKSTDGEGYLTSSLEPEVLFPPAASGARLDRVNGSMKKAATRRNSLSDLKIPSRISKAQHGIRSNMNLVRDFAKGIEELKLLRAQYMERKLQEVPDATKKPEMIQNWLECADVLIGLGEGRSEADSMARVDTLSHTPLSMRVAGTNTSISEASERTSLITPHDLASGADSAMGARSASGASHSTASTTESARSVNVQREIDILSAILGGIRTDSGSASAFIDGSAIDLSRTKSLLQRPTQGVLAGKSFADSDVSTEFVSLSGASLTSADMKSDSPNDNNNKAERRKSPSKADHPYHTAPPMGGSSTSLFRVTSTEAIDVSDGNRSAKRRLRSASRAGLQGLRDLIKAFRGNGNEGSEAQPNVAGISEKPQQPSPQQREPPPSAFAFGRKSIDKSRQSMDEGDNASFTPRKTKRRSLNVKRRSFLRTKGSNGDGLPDDDGKASSAEQLIPPMPSSPERRRSGLIGAVKVGYTSPPRKSLDLSMSAHSPRLGARQVSAPTPTRGALDPREVDRERNAALASLHGVSFAAKPLIDNGEDMKRSPGTFRTSKTADPQVGPLQQQSQRSMQEQLLASQTTPTRKTVRLSGNFDPHKTAEASELFAPGRGSISVDSICRSRDASKPNTPLRTQSSMETSTVKAPMVQKLALRPEAMPGLLVYVQATKQHLQAAIDGL